MICPVCAGKLFRIDEDTVEPCPECIGGRTQCCEGIATEPSIDDTEGE